MSRSIGCGCGVGMSSRIWMPIVELVNGDFEGSAGPPPYGWIAFHATGTRAAGTRTGGGGSFVGNLAWNGVNASGYFLQYPLTVGELIRAIVWCRSVDGVSVPYIACGSHVGIGSNSTSWQMIDETFVVPTSTVVALACDNLAAGRSVEFDDLQIWRKAR